MTHPTNPTPDTPPPGPAGLDGGDLRAALNRARTALTDAQAAAGDGSWSKTVQTAVNRSVAAVDRAWEVTDEDAKAAQARAEVERLKAELAAAEQALRAATGKNAPKPTTAKTKPATPAGPTVPEGVDPAEVRTWAAGNGYTVASHGRIPRHVIDDYLAAHQAEAVAS